MIGRRLGVLLLVGLLLWAPPPLGAQDAGDAGRAALGRLSKSLEQGAVVGRLVDRTRGNYIFMPDSPDLPKVPVLNPGNVLYAAVGPRLRLQGTYDAAKGGVLVHSYSVALTSPNPPVTGGALPVERTLSALQRQLSRALQPDTTRDEVPSPEIDPMIGASARAAERELDAAYRDAVERGEDEERRAAVRALADVREELKSIYGGYGYDNNSPWNYAQIFVNSKSVVALAEPGQQSQALCTGVLIARDLVLTAGHCFERHDPEDLQVWFGFVETAGGEPPAPVGFDVVELVAPPGEQHREFLERAVEKRFDAEVLDYAVLRFDVGDGASLPSEVAPLCLRAAHISRGRRIYLVGYPKGRPQTVHDGRVYLPFRLRPRQFEDLKKEIEVDFAHLEDADRLRLLEEFVASYVERPHGTTSVFELRDTRFGGQPKLGILADTFLGNSGSPVFDRENHCIAGILTGGTPDVGQRLGASSLFHQTVLPMPAILADLAEHSQTATLVEDGLLTIR